MRHAFQALPGQVGKARPVVDLIVEGLDLAPQACLIDTGATQIRMGRHVAELAGLDLTAGVTGEVVVGGLRTDATGMPVELELRQESSSHVWTPNVYFCDPWPWAFGLLGLGGLDPFVLTIDAYEEWTEFRPR